MSCIKHFIHILRWEEGKHCHRFIFIFSWQAFDFSLCPRRTIHSNGILKNVQEHKILWLINSNLNLLTTLNCNNWIVLTFGRGRKNYFCIVNVCFWPLGLSSPVPHPRHLPMLLFFSRHRRTCAQSCHLVKPSFTFLLPSQVSPFPCIFVRQYSQLKI